MDLPEARQSDPATDLPDSLRFNLGLVFIVLWSAGMSEAQGVNPSQKSRAHGLISPLADTTAIAERRGVDLEHLPLASGAAFK